ncbi:MAG: peptidylprolyl isomerase [Victivallaceae bacterium]|nr:peptidylprolyl isomerase [Victivallaceae bacterium]
MRKMLIAVLAAAFSAVVFGEETTAFQRPKPERTSLFSHEKIISAAPSAPVQTALPPPVAAEPSASPDSPAAAAPDAPAAVEPPAVQSEAAAVSALSPAAADDDAQVEFYDTVVASVDGEPIVLSEVWLESQPDEARLSAMLTGQELEDAVVEQRRKVVNSLIDRRLLRKEFKPDEYKLDNQVIESLLDDWAAAKNCKTRVDLERWARRNRTSIPEMRRKVMDYLIEQYVLFRQFTIEVNVTPRETYEYFKAHEADYAQRESLHLRAIYLDGSKADFAGRVASVGAGLAAEPGRFAELAAEYTDGPFRAGAGDLGWLERGQLRTLFADALGVAPEVGKPIGPISAPEGGYFLMVEEFRPAVEPDFPALERAIRERLENERRTAAYDEYLGKLREKAVIRYY